MSKNKFSQKLIRSLVATVILVLGMTLILVWQKDVMCLLRATIGLILSLAGLVMLYSLSKP